MKRTPYFMRGVLQGVGGFEIKNYRSFFILCPFILSAFPYHYHHMRSLIILGDLNIISQTKERISRFLRSVKVAQFENLGELVKNTIIVA